MRLRHLAQPRGTLWGFALFLAVNATSVWGGVFPFLPDEFQIDAVTVSFFVAQTSACSLSHALAVVGTYLWPAPARRALELAGPWPTLAGSCTLIAAMYLRIWALKLVLCSGVLLGLGSTVLMLSWQRALSSLDSERACMLSVAGTGLSALIYFAMCLCPLSVTAFLVPLVFVPLCGTALALALRDAHLRQAFPADTPREQSRVYLRALRDYWRSGLTVGGLGFVTGVLRALAIKNPEVGQVVNVASMAGALASSLALIVLWRRFSFRFSTSRALRIVFPPLACGVALLPFLGQGYLDSFAGLAHMLFSFAQMTLMVQCLQASRDRGLDVGILFGLCGGMAQTLQCLGLLAGWNLGLSQPSTSEQVAIAALICASALGMTLYLVWGTQGHASPVANEAEFLSLSDTPKREKAAPGEATPAMRDRVSKQCEAIRLHFRLSARETEVMEHIARGDTVPRIAAELEVSENTVRTHAKRIYAKLGIHSKQELGDLIAQFRPAEV